MADYLIKEETLNNLADSVRILSGETGEMTPDEMIAVVTSTKSAIDSLNEHIDDKNNPHQVTAAQVGADASGTATSAVNTHNSSSTAHSDIRTAVSNAQTTANNAASAASAAQTAVANKAPMYSYGTADLTAGSSPLESGKLYFVYE